MPQTEVWIALRDGVEGDGSQQSPYDGSYVMGMTQPYRFDNRLRLLFEEGQPFYIHIERGDYLTQGNYLDANTGWRMNDGWIIAGSGVGATTVKLREFTFDPTRPSNDQGKRFVIGTYSTQNVQTLVVRDLTINANWDALIGKPTNGKTAVLSVAIYSQGNATVENVRSINTYGDRASENECFSIFLGHRDEIDPRDAVLPSTLAIRNCIAEAGHGDYVVGMAAFAQRMVDMRGNVCRDLPNGANPSSAYQFSGRGITFTDNKSENCPVGLYFDTANIYDALIANNQFLGCRWAGILTSPGSNFFAINVRQGGSGLDGRYVDVPVKLATEPDSNYRVRMWLSLGGSLANEPPMPTPGHRVKVDYNQGDPIAGVTGIEQKIANALNADNPPGIGHLFSGSTVEAGAVYGRLSGSASWAGHAGTSIRDEDKDYLYAQRGYEFQNWVIDNNLIEIELGYWTAQQFGVRLIGTGAPGCRDYTITNNYVRYTGTYMPGGGIPYNYSTELVGGHLTACENRSAHVPVLNCCNAAMLQLPGSTRYFLGNRISSGPAAGGVIPGLEDTELHVNRPGLEAATVVGAILENTTEATASASQNSPAIQWMGHGWRLQTPGESRPVDFRAYVSPSPGQANPGGSWILESSINGAAFGNQLAYTSGGGLVVPGSITAGGTGAFATLTAITAAGPVILSPSNATVTISPANAGVTISPSNASVTLAPTNAGVAISPFNGGVTISPNGGGGSVTISPGGGNAVTIAPSGSLNLGATGSSETFMNGSHVNIDPSPSNTIGTVKIGVQETSQQRTIISSGQTGTMDNMNIGSTTRGTGAFTTLSATLTITATGGFIGLGTGLTGLTKSQVGLSNVDNTSDATKNAATATLTNKAISGANNTLSNIDGGNMVGNIAIARIATALTAPGPIGGTTPGSGSFTTLTASGIVTLSPSNATVTISPAGSGGSVTISPGNSVTISPSGGGVTISPSSNGVTIAPGGGNAVTIAPTGSLTLGATGSSATNISSGSTGYINNLHIGYSNRQTGTFTQVGAYDVSMGNTSTTDFRRALFLWSGGDFFIETSALGSGTIGFNHLNLKTGPGKQIRFHGGSGASAVNIWNFDAGGHVVPATDNTYDIGASTASPADVYAARGFVHRAVSLSPASTVTINFSGALGQAWQSITLTGNVTFQSGNLAAGREITVRIIAGSSSRSLTFPGGWKFVGGIAPTSLAANKTALLILRSFSSTDADVVGEYEVEP